MCFTSESPTLLSCAPLRADNLTLQQAIVLFTIVSDYLRSSLSSASTIFAWQVRELCPVLPQRPQCLSARALFVALLPSSCSPASLGAIKSSTSPTVKVSSLRIYFLLRLLRCVAASAAYRYSAISLRINTTSCAIIGLLLVS